MDDPSEKEIAALKDHYLGCKVVAYVGILKREKGLHVAIDAAALVKEKHPDSLFLFIGSMVDPVNVRTLVSKRGLGKNIRFLPQMGYQQMLAHLHYAKIGLALHQNEHIYPYVSAGNGRKLFSYMQAGVAIIAPDFGEIGNAVDVAKCGILINTGDAEEVANTIIQLLSDPKETARMANNGRKAFLKNYNWEIEQEKFYTFINDIVT
jgi:glycosyltransferase involved in cell wall biosynthesis